MKRKLSRGDFLIYLISDLHGTMSFPALEKYLELATENDILIILGDVGLNFEETQENREFTRYFMSLNKKIAFLDGNHENFEYLDSLEKEEWSGGIVGRLSENIVHLRRGNIYTIQGKNFFAFGGCKSSPKWKEKGLWHEGEEPNVEELMLAYENLKRYNYKVDYIITHKYEYNEKYVSEKLKELEAFIDKNVIFNKWYSGHWHENFNIDDSHIVVYDKLTSII